MIMLGLGFEITVFTVPLLTCRVLVVLVLAVNGS